MRLLSRPHDLPTDDVAEVIDLDLPVTPPPAAATSPQPVVAAAPSTSPPAAAPAPIPEEPDDDLWPTGGPPKGVRLRLPTLALLSFAVAAAGFVGGAAAYKAKGPTTATVATAGFPGGGAGFTPPGGTGSTAGGTGTGTGTGTRTGGQGAAGAGTTGTVSSVDGSTFYVTDSSGNLKKVTVADGATVTATRAGTASDIRPGDTVVITGSTGADGTTQASAVAVNPTSNRGGGGAAPAAAAGTSAPNAATP